MPSGFVQHRFLTLLALLTTLLSLSAALPFDFKSFVDSNFIPTKGGNTIADELQCYALPYGGLGFLSHVLTYWTVACLIVGVKPLMPWKPLGHSTIDFYLNVVSLIITVPMTAFTIVRCRNRWQFICLAIWKMTMSLTLSGSGVHRSILLRSQPKHQTAPYVMYTDLTNAKEAEDPPKRHRGKVFAWLILYGFGTIVGLAGLTSLVKHTFDELDKVRIVCYVFAAVVVAGAIGAGLVFCFISQCAAAFITVALVPIGIGGLAAFFSDWVLGAINSQGWLGVPSEDTEVIYWSYFAAKRLPMFSW